MRRVVSWVAGVALVGSGCAAPATSDGGGDALETGLVHSLNVRVEAETVRFTLNVTNAGAGPLVLEFSSSQRYDFAVESAAGGVVWTWSADRMFAQVMGTDTVAAGATRTYEASWPAPGGPGRYTAVGRVTSSNSPVELRTEFEIPAS